MADEKDVERVAKLARIEISESEKESLKNQLSKIIGYIDKLKEVNTEGIEPLRGLHAKRNVFREDKASSSSSKEDILKNSPLRKGNYFKIPKVLE